MGVISCDVPGCDNILCTYQINSSRSRDYNAICICDDCRERFEEKYTGKVFSRVDFEMALEEFTDGFNTSHFIKDQESAAIINEIFESYAYRGD